MSEAYVHGHRPRGHERLQDQAGTLVEPLHSDTAYPPSSRVLGAGCGVGAQTVALARRSPDARFTSVDVSAESIAEADGVFCYTFFKGVGTRSGRRPDEA